MYIYIYICLEESWYKIIFDFFKFIYSSLFSKKKNVDNLKMAFLLSK